MSPLVILDVALAYAPKAIQSAAWVIRFRRWREEKAKRGELDSQRVSK